MLNSVNVSKKVSESNEYMQIEQEMDDELETLINAFFAELDIDLSEDGWEWHDFCLNAHSECYFPTALSAFVNYCYFLRPY